MTEFDGWLREYEMTRYLRKLSDERLRLRMDDLAQNLWSTDREGHVTPPKYQKNRTGVLRLYSHLLFEGFLRNPNSNKLILNEKNIRKKASAKYVRPTIDHEILFHPDCFSKFGKKEHIIDAYENGRFRIAPASSYSDSSLNVAQMDDELENFVRTPNKVMMMELWGSETPDGPIKKIELEPIEYFEYKNSENFYVWCCALSYDARMFSEFEANSVLIIHDKEEFSKRLELAVLKQKNELVFERGPIRYYDAYTCQHNQLTRGFSKEIKYLYQNEYRFIWRLEQEMELEPFFVELGSLKDIASIRCLM